MTRAPIRFGTSGWRGVLGDEFTFERLRALAAAVGRSAVRREPGARILVTHDTRFLADAAARAAASVLAGARARPILAAGPTPTPVAAHAVRRGRYAAGLLVTASHNPAEYLGVKVLTAGGIGVSRREADRLERACARVLAGHAPRRGAVPARRAHPKDAYLRALSGLLDRDRISRARLAIGYDALHGTGAGVLDRLLTSLGARVTVLRAEPDPRFGGGAPDPAPGRLADLTRWVAARRGRALGLATDGDADRLAVLGHRGRLSETEGVALLVDHLARTRRPRGAVAISVATGTLVERVAEAAGLAVTRHPLGFGPLTAALESGAAVLAGEESGGFAWAPFCHDKDGLLAGALIAEVAASHRGGIDGQLRELRRVHGTAACGRRAVRRGPGHTSALQRLREAPPALFDGSRVRAETTPGGAVLRLDDGFAIVRASGTEPVVRLYAEAPSEGRLASRLAAAAALLARAAR